MSYFCQTCERVHVGQPGSCGKPVAASSAPAETPDPGLQEERRQFNTEIGSLRAQVVALQAERDRYKAALEQIVANEGMTLLSEEWDRGYEFGANAAFGQAAAEARAALAPQAREKEQR